MQRRDLLKSIPAVGWLSMMPGTQVLAKPVPAKNFIYCLNMATIRGHNLGLVKELEVASRAGFRAVEIWVDSLDKYQKQGGSLSDLAKRLKDLNVTVANAIGFATWIIDDEAKRAAALEQMKKEMEMLAVIGCKRTAAPPAGATTGAALDLDVVAKRYRDILELGDKTGVVPHLELWGFATNLNQVSKVMYVALQSGHPSAKILLDVYHLYKGGSGTDTLPLINPNSCDILHMNDYKSEISRATITDADRIYPGDGNAPIAKILKALSAPGHDLYLSCEVFNKEYYKQEPLLVAKTALERMKQVTSTLR